MKDTQIARRGSTLVFCCFLIAPPLGAAETVPANWFSNATSIVNVIDPAPTPERLRLQAGFTQGHVEGVVDLGTSDRWLVWAAVSTDGQADIPSEFVSVLINGVMVAEFFNTPTSTDYFLQAQVSGDAFTYRFEFSSPSTNEGSHLIVQQGMVTSCPGDQDCDGDGVSNATDNCLFSHNPDQRDTDGDNFGNVCDADLDNDCTVNFSDLGLIKAVFFSDDPDADFDGDNTVSFSDLAIMKAHFFAAPGPSGLEIRCRS